MRVSAPWRWTRPQPQSAPLSGNARVPPTGVPNAHGCGIVMNACFGVGEEITLLISPACIAAGTSAKIMLILTHFGVSGDDPARLLLLLLVLVLL